MNILVTGGLGLIGHNVVAELERLSHDVVILDNKTTYGVIPETEVNYLMTERLKKVKTNHIYNFDISSKDVMHWIEWIIKKHNIDTIIHLASLPRQKLVGLNPILATQTMSEGLLNLLEVSKKNDIKKFVYISSSMVYGTFTDQVTEDAICNPEGQYGILKLAGEWLVKDYSRITNMAHTIIRPSAVYGPLDVTDRVVAKFMLTAKDNGVLKVNGINEILDFTYVDDAAKGIVAATLSDSTNNKTYNLTKSHSRSLLDAAKLCVKIVGSGSIEIREKSADFPSRGALNIDAARRDFNYDPKIDVEEGFEKYYQWLKNSSFWT
jgi:nucleoside-diphosphate-sugar epimerase